MRSIICAKNRINRLIILSTLVTTKVGAVDSSISHMAKHVIEQMSAMVSVLTIIAYTAGVGFTISGIMQFKTHKDNPQQTPLSKPVVLVIVAACLLFLPSVIGTAGVSLFGERAVSVAKGRGQDLSGL